jgi:glycosyltransferase involved in cell wall biosynthesis
VHLGVNAHLLAGADGFRRAGIHGYIYQLLDALPGTVPDWQFTVFTGNGRPPQHPQFTIRRSRLDTQRPLNRILWEQVAQPRQLLGCDLVHQPAFVAPVLSARPFVVTVHDLSFIRYPERLSAARRIYLRLFTGLSCRRARRVIAVSQSTADDLVSILHIPREKIDVVISGVQARFQPLPSAEVARFRAERGLPDRFFLFVGTLEPRKNLTILLRAYAALPKADRSAVHLVLAGGKGWMTDDVPHMIAEHDLSDTVHLPGYVPDSDLVLWYNAAETFVYPSVFEGWGLPVIEAMACGTPVITSSASSLPEAAGEAGLMLDPQRAEAWTEGLLRAMHNPGWREDYARRGLERSRQFTWEQTAQRTVESYRKALTA